MYNVHKRSPLLKCVSIWALPERVGGARACQDGLEHFFPTFAGGEWACQDGLEHFFFHICPFDRGGGVKSYLGSFLDQIPTGTGKELPQPQIYKLVRPFKPIVSAANQANLKYLRLKHLDFLDQIIPNSKTCFSR